MASTICALSATNFIRFASSRSLNAFRMISQPFCTYTHNSGRGPFMPRWIPEPGCACTAPGRAAQSAAGFAYRPRGPRPEPGASGAKPYRRCMNSWGGSAPVASPERHHGERRSLGGWNAGSLSSAFRIQQDFQRSSVSAIALSVDSIQPEGGAETHSVALRARPPTDRHLSTDLKRQTRELIFKH